MILDRLPDPVKHGGDLAAASLAGASFVSHAIAQAMPTLILILSAIWTLIRIFETRTAQAALKRLRTMWARDADL